MNDQESIVTQTDSPREASAYVVPKWFMRFLSSALGISGAIAMAAIPWAWTLSNDISGIRIELRSANELNSAKLADVYRRLDRLESWKDTQDKWK